MNKTVPKAHWRWIPLTVVAIAVVVVGLLVRPATQTSAFHVLTPQQAHQLRAQMHTGQIDADLIKRPTANREGSPSSADQQFTQERAYPAGDIPAAGYSNGFNQYSLMSQPGGGSFGWKELGPLTTSDGSVWGPAAPGTISGRATAIAVDPSTCSGGSCKTIYLGTANGGVWKSTSGGPNWVALFDHQSSLSVGSIALDPHNSNTIYVGLGEPNNSIDSSRGQGILKSTNGGHTWTTLGFSTFVNRSVADLVVDPSSGNLYAASYEARSGGAGTTYGSGLQNPYLPPLGFYRSTDGGQTWTLSNPTTPLQTDYTGRQGATSLVQGANGALYLGIYNQGIYKSINGGQNWTALSNSAETTFDRVTLAVAPSDPSIVYAAYSHDIDGHGGETLYRSADGGDTWTAQPNTPSACTGQCWYDMPVAISPSNASEVYLGGMFNYVGCPSNSDGTFPSTCNTVIEKSLNGGETWHDIGDPTTGVNVHPDDHAILPTANGGLYTGNDGGLYHSSDDGSTWASLNNGIGSLQFQGVSVNSNGDVFGGTQDNGTWMLRHSSTTGVHILGGDGGMTMADPSNSNIAFDEYYGPQVERFDASNGSQTFVSGWWCDYFCFGSGLFYEPMAMGTKTATGAGATNDVFSGSYRLWRSELGGGINGNPGQDQYGNDATNDPSDTTDFVPITPNVGNISAIVVNPTNPNDVAFATSAGHIYYTTNALAPVQLANACNPTTPLPATDPTAGIVGAHCGYGYFSTTASGADTCSQPWANVYDTSSMCYYVSGINWTRLDQNSSGTQLPNRWISSLAFDSTGKLYATFSGFDENTPGFAGHVFVTSGPVSTTGTTWTNISGTGSNGIPDVPANGVVVAPSGHIFVAADIGLFGSKDGGQSWQREDYTLANAPIYDLALSPDGKTLYAATHGRGIWRANVP